MSDNVSSKIFEIVKIKEKERFEKTEEKFLGIMRNLLEKRRKNSRYWTGFKVQNNIRYEEFLKSYFENKVTYEDLIQICKKLGFILNVGDNLHYDNCIGLAVPEWKDGEKTVAQAMVYDLNTQIDSDIKLKEKELLERIYEESLKKLEEGDFKTSRKNNFYYASVKIKSFNTLRREMYKKLTSIFKMEGIVLKDINIRTSTLTFEFEEK